MLPTIKQNLKCCPLTNKDLSRAPRAFSTPLNVKLTYLESEQGQRITALRAAIRKTIELLNEPYVRLLLEQRGIDVDEKLADLRSRFTVLAKFPLYSENATKIPKVKYDYHSSDFIECEKDFSSPLKYLP